MKTKEKNSRLVGGKEIAAYLGTSVRNVYRWEKELGLPIRRIADSKGRSVYVDVEELEKWMRNQKYVPSDINKESSKIVKRRIIIFISAIVITLLIGLFAKKSNWNRFDRTAIEDFLNPVTASLEGDIIHIKNQKGKMLWPYRAMASEMHSSLKKWDHNRYIDFLDIDKDGANEVVTRKYDDNEDKYGLVLYDNDGSILWERYVYNEQEYKGINLGSSFFALDIEFAHSLKNEQFIVTNWKHAGRFLSLITCHDCKGALCGKYIHCGNLCSMEIFDLNQDGNDEIIFSGTNNLLNGEGILGVLNLTGFKGVNPPFVIEPEHSHLSYLESYVPNEPQPGNQLIYIRFRKTSHLNDYQGTYIMPKIDDIGVSVVHIIHKPWLIEPAHVSIGFEYVFDNSFNLSDLVPDAPLRKYYPALLKNNEISISLKELCNIYKKNLLRWENGIWIPIN